MMQRPTQRTRRDLDSTACTDLNRWVKAVRELPDVRLEKIVTAQSALRNHRYRDDRYLDLALEKLRRDMILTDQ